MLVPLLAPLLAPAAAGSFLLVPAVQAAAPAPWRLLLPVPLATALFLRSAVLVGATVLRLVALFLVLPVAPLAWRLRRAELALR